MKVITGMNFKGGSGKTTVTYHLAAGLANRGYKTLLVDADAQANATYLCGVAEAPTFHDFLVRRAPMSSVIQPVPRAHYALSDTAAPMFVIPSNIETSAIPMEVSDPFVAHRRFHELKGFVDVIVVDTSPAASFLQTVLFIGTDAIIYPTKLEALSIGGLQKSLEHRARADEMKINNKLTGVQVMGVLPTMYKASTLEHNEYLDWLCDTCVKQDYTMLPELTDRIVWAEASRAKQPVFCFEPDGKAAKEVWDMIDHVVARL